MRCRWSVVLVALSLATVSVKTQVKTAVPAPTGSPTIDDLISLKRAGSPAISPDGRLVAYTVRAANWDDNTYQTQIWLADIQQGTSRQLTNAAKSSTAPAWAPDASRIAFVSDRSDKRQIY